MNLEYEALGLYYFSKKSAKEAALAVGMDPKSFAEKVHTLDSECIKIFEEFYATENTSLGYIASQHNINRNIIYGFSIRYGINQSQGDKASKKRLNTLKKVA